MTDQDTKPPILTRAKVEELRKLCDGFPLRHIALTEHEMLAILAALDAAERMAESAAELLSSGGQVITLGHGPFRCEVCGSKAFDIDKFAHKDGCEAADLLQHVAAYRAIAPNPEAEGGE